MFTYMLTFVKLSKDVAYPNFSAPKLTKHGPAQVFGIFQAWLFAHSIISRYHHYLSLWISAPWKTCTTSSEVDVSSFSCCFCSKCFWVFCNSLWNSLSWISESPLAESSKWATLWLRWRCCRTEFCLEQKIIHVLAFSSQSH